MVVAVLLVPLLFDVPVDGGLRVAVVVELRVAVVVEDVHAESGGQLFDPGVPCRVFAGLFVYDDPSFRFGGLPFVELFLEQGGVEVSCLGRFDPFG